MRKPRSRSRTPCSALCSGLALVAGLLLGPLAQPGLAEEPYGVEVLPAKATESAETPEAPVASPGDEAERASAPVVLVIAAPGTQLLLDPPFPPPDVSARGWNPDRPSPLRVHAGGAGSSRIPVVGWNPERPSRVRVHSWSDGTP